MFNYFDVNIQISKYEKGSFFKVQRKVISWLSACIWTCLCRSIGTVVPSNWEREGNTPAFIPIQDYNTLNRNPQGLTGWINHKHAFFCRKVHGSHGGVERGVFLEETEERKWRNSERKDGWEAKVLKRGDKTLASVPKERKGEDFTRWWTEGGREGWGLGKEK